MKHEIVGHVWLNWYINFQGRNFGTRSQFDVYNSLLKVLSKNYNFLKRNIGPWTHVAPRFPKECCLGPQNGSRSSRLEKLLKIVNYATITETEKLKETVVGIQM